MSSSVTMFDRLDWPDIAAQLDLQGYAVLSGLLTPEQARHAAQLPALRGVSLARAGLGRGELLGFGDALPAPWDVWRVALYRRLAPIANHWNARLDAGLDAGYRYPAELDVFLQHNRQAGQVRPQSHLTRLRTGDYIALHQRSDGKHVFPLQVIALLSEPGVDFLGGEFVMTEQRPRMQSRPMVLPLALGDLAIIGTAQRPFRGARGDYRVNLRHAISRVRDGERIGVELSFHDDP
ncbi:2OG-Fe(II) oxygenase [Cupriavidus yeoncheonensis]|nr:2OG-Fe(II) oxygenase [Cupriavidus yeoncheonensis]